MLGLTSLLDWLCPLYPDTYDTPDFESELMTKKITTLLPSSIEWEIVVLQNGDFYYVYCPNINYKFDITNIPQLEWLMKHSFTVIRKPQDVDLDDWDNLYLCANADCFDPPIYLVSAQHESDALEEFICKTNACIIEERDLKDYVEPEPDSLDQPGYSDRVTWDDNGRPNDTEAVVIHPLTVAAAYKINE